MEEREHEEIDVSPLPSDDVAGGTGPPELLTTALDRTLEYLEEFTALRADEERWYLALWTAMTYVQDQCSAVPYLQLYSALPGAGKTYTMDVLREVVRNATQRLGNVSAAMLPYLIQKHGEGNLTMFFDEIDMQFSGDADRRDAIAGILNDGYKRGGVYGRLREKGNGHYEVIELPAYCAKAFAGIGDKLQPATRDRCTKIQMTVGMPRRNLDEQEPEDLQMWTRPIRAMFESWSGKVLVPRVPMEVPERMTGRRYEVWKPLVVIAELASEDWRKRCFAAFEKLGIDGHRSQDHKTLLLQHLYEFWTGNHSMDNDRQPTGVLIEWLRNEVDEGPWTEVFSKSAQANAQHLANLLRDFGIRSNRWRDGENRYRGYERAKFLPVFQQYAAILTNEDDE